MSPRLLPDRPNLNQYKKQAKELVKAVKSNVTIDWTVRETP